MRFPQALSALKKVIDEVADDALRLKLRAAYEEVRDQAVAEEPRYGMREAFGATPEGRDILLRAWTRDPVRTETDVIRLGRGDLASIIGSEYQAAYERGEVQLEMYEESP